MAAASTSLNPATGANRQAAAYPFALRFLPSFADFAFLLPLVYIFGRMDGAGTLLGDGDTGWHIRAGEWILANGRVPTADMFSFTMPGRPWYAWEWLSEIVLALLNQAGGLAAVVLFSAALIGVTSVLVFRMARERSNTLIGIAVAVLVAGASAIHWLARPHLFTLFFVALFYGFLERIRSGRTHLGRIPYLVLMPVVTILWTNLHGGFFVGVVLIVTYGIVDMAEALLAGDSASRTAHGKRAISLWLCAAGCMAASLINPYTYHLHVHMLKYLTDPWYSQHITEFFSPSFHNPAGPWISLMLCLGAGGAFWSLTKRRFAEAVVVLMWCHASLLAARNVPLMGIVAAPVIAAGIHEWLHLAANRTHVAQWFRTFLGRYMRMAQETGETEAVPRFHLASVFGLAFLGLLLFAPNPPAKFRSEFNPKNYPSGALATLRSDANARIFTQDEWGDYLVWQLYPAHKVFVDGRSDFYGDNFMDEYIAVMDVKVGWQKTLSRFGVNTIVLPPTAALAGALKLSSDWRVVFDDGGSLVFRAAGYQMREPVSVAEGSGISRDREITKTAIVIDRSQKLNHKN